jgi:hypothetical protein
MLGYTILAISMPQLLFLFAKKQLCEKNNNSLGNKNSIGQYFTMPIA